MTEQATAPKEAWITPEIRTLDVAETQTRSRRGSDGNARYADCTRS
jgi:hypothetical protein